MKTYQSCGKSHSSDVRKLTQARHADAHARRFLKFRSVRNVGLRLNGLSPSEETMEQELKYPDWQEPFLQAISEHRGFIEIETIIRGRLRSLISSESEEREALMDAFATIQVLKEDYAYGGWLRHLP